MPAHTTKHICNSHEPRLKPKITSESLDLDQMQAVWDKESNKIHHSLMLSPILKNPAVLLVYVWNKRKVEFRVLKGEVVVYSINYP